MTLLPKILKTKITRENFVLVGILVIALAIPLTVILLGIRQELRKRAVETQGSILINAGAETTNSPSVTLTLTAPAGVTPPPTETFSGDAADGNILGYGSYDEAYSTSYNSDDSNETFQVGQQDVGGTGRKRIDRGYVLFDTSEIPDNATITSVRLCLRISGVGPLSNPFDVGIHKLDFSTPIGGSREGNYDGALSAPLDQNLVSLATGGSVGPEVCNTTSLDPAWVSKTGYTKYALLNSRDVSGQAPEQYEDESIIFYAAESAYPPRLEVIYTTSSAQVPTLISKAHAQNSSCSGYCVSLGYDGGACMTGCGAGYDVNTSWSGCPPTQIPGYGEIPGVCCCKGDKIPIPTPTSFSQGCTLSCSDAGTGISSCSVSSVSGAASCRISHPSYSGAAGACGACAYWTYRYCDTDGSSPSGTATATVTAYSGGECNGQVIASCSTSFNMNCEFTPPEPPVCEGLEGPDQAAPGSFNFFRISGDPGSYGLFGWSATCGSFPNYISSTNTWTAPETPGTCTITASVSDGHGGVGECTKDVTVVEVPPSGVEAMVISNYEDFRDGVEEPFTTVKNWTLTAGDGLKTVWAKFKVGGFWTTPVSDSITLSTGGPTPTPTPGGPTPTPTTPPGTPTPTTPPGTPTPTPTTPPGGWLKLDLLKVWFWKQEGALGRGHEGSVILALKQGGNLVLEKEVKLDENGEARNVELPGVEAGTYDAFIYEAGYLTKKLASVQIGESGNELDFTKGGTEYFLVGDFNGDQEVNILDFSIFVKSYGKQGEE